jgi:aromatic-L-amino-acid decarboxylase
MPGMYYPSTESSLPDSKKGTNLNRFKSCLFVRNRLDLTNAMDITPTYLRNPYSDQGTVIDYRNWQIPLGRRFRSLKIWFVMRSYGLSGMKAFIRRGLALGDFFADKVRKCSDLFEIVTEPAYCLTVLRVRNPAVGVNGTVHGGQDGHVTQVDEKANAITKEVYELINKRGEIFLTSTIIAGVYAIRVVSCNEQANEKDVSRAFEILVETTVEVLAKSR